MVVAFLFAIVRHVMIVIMIMIMIMMVLMVMILHPSLLPRFL